MVLAVDCFWVVGAIGLRCLFCFVLICLRCLVALWACLTAVVCLVFCGCGSIALFLFAVVSV